MLISALGETPSPEELQMCKRGTATLCSGRAQWEAFVSGEFENCQRRLLALQPQKAVELRALLPLPSLDACEDYRLILSGGGDLEEELSSGGARESQGRLTHAQERHLVVAAREAVKGALREKGELRLGAEADVRHLFTAVVAHYQSFPSRLPCNDYVVVNAVVAVEMLFAGPVFLQGLLRLREGRVSTARSVRVGEVLDVVPVSAVRIGAAPAHLLNIQWDPDDLFVKGDVSVSAEGSLFTPIAAVDDYCQNVFGKGATFFGDCNEVAVRLVAAKSERDVPVELRYYAGFWPCLVATAPLCKDFVLLEGVPEEGLLAGISAANALAQERRRERRKGGGHAVLRRPPWQPVRELLAATAPFADTTKERKKTSKNEEISISNLRRRVKEEARSKEALLRETPAAFGRSEENLQSLEDMQLERRVLKTFRAPRAAKTKPSDKMSASVVKQLFFQEF